MTDATIWAVAIAVCGAVAGLALAYFEGRRARGQTADAEASLHQALHQATIDQLEAALANEEAQAEALKQVVASGRAVIAAVSTADPSERHRLLLSQAQPTAGPAQTSGEAKPGNTGEDPSPAG